MTVSNYCEAGKHRTFQFDIFLFGRMRVCSACYRRLSSGEVGVKRKYLMRGRVYVNEEGVVLRPNVVVE